MSYSKILKNRPVPPSPSNHLIVKSLKEGDATIKKFVNHFASAFAIAGPSYKPVYVINSVSLSTFKVNLVECGC